MAANDDYPYRLMGQRYQDMCDEIDALRALGKTVDGYIDQIRTMDVTIEELREMDMLAGEEIERLTAEVEGLKKAIALYKGDEF